jgi:phospholipid/cholesterol/gamma-HCH transport system permease protein
VATAESGRATAPATAELRTDGSATTVALAGTWRLGEVQPSFDSLITANTTSGSPPLAIAFDAAAITEWDSSLLIFVSAAESYGETQGCRVDRSGLPEKIIRLLDLSRAVAEREAPPATPALSRVAKLGLYGIATWDSAMSALTFLGEFAQGLGRLATRQTRMQWRQFWVVVESNSSRALPIVTLIALLVGVIIAFLGVVVLQKFGAGYYVSYLVGYGMLREMGALMTGIIIAGRTGAAFAAEIGSMKVTEELDAYETLGISPVDHLVLPRVLGLFVMMPLLTIYADIVGILGGMGVAIALLNLSVTQFNTGLLDAVSLSDALLGAVKATIFGVIIGLSGCMHGLRTGNDASAVGRAATSAVVLGITLIITANAVVDWMAALWQI